MCVIFVCYKRPEKKMLENGYKANPHGMGIAYINNGRLRIYKDVQPTIERLWNIVEEYDPPYVIHFRLRSAGAISKEACHPFKIHKTVALAHNGHIHQMDVSFTRSDTQQLVAELRRFRIYDIRQLARILRLVGGGKYALMNANGDIKTVGQFEKVESGIWASNMGWSYPSITKLTINRPLPWLARDKEWEESTSTWWDKVNWW